MDEIEDKKQEFIKAFKTHMGKDERKVFAEKLKMSVQYVGLVLNNKTSLKLDAQTKIANALGLTLEEFLNYREKRGNPSAENSSVPIRDQIEKEHCELVGRFKNKEAGKEANEYLLKIEQLSTIDFHKAIGILKGMAIELEEKQAATQDPRKTGTEGNG